MLLILKRIYSEEQNFSNPVWPPFMQHFVKIFLIGPLLVLSLANPLWAQTKNPLIAAASSLRVVMAQLEEEFMNTGGTHLRISFGSSGNLARQIAQGGPYELFLSANEAYVTPLIKAGLTQGHGKQYALGRLVFISSKKSMFDATTGLAGLKAALKSNTIKHIAIANPDHAPYGRAAKQVLVHAGIWQDIQPYLIFGENIAQATQFAVSSAAQGGLVSYSLALAPAIAQKTRHTVIPENWHKPLKHHMVLLKKARPGARKFYDFLTTPRAQAILAAHGFSPALMR